MINRHNQRFWLDRLEDTDAKWMKICREKEQRIKELELDFAEMCERANEIEKSLFEAGKTIGEYSNRVADLEGLLIKSEKHIAKLEQMKSITWRDND